MEPWEKYAGAAPMPDVKPWEKYLPSIDGQQIQESAHRTIFDQGMQGATFGFADELQDRIGAGIASLYTGESYDDLLTEARQLSQSRLNRQMEQRPVLSLASNIAGGIVTGAAGATTKAGSAVGNSLRTGNLAARAAKSAAAGAASGGLYGAGAGADGERAESAGRGAVLGGVLGAAAPVAGAGIRRLNTRTIIPGADEVREAASKLYQKAEAAGGALSPKFSNSFVSAARKKLLSDDSLVNSMRSNSRMRDAMADLEAFQNQPMTLTRAQALDEQLGNMIDGFVDANGNLEKGGKKLLEVQRTFRDMIEKADDRLMLGSREGLNALKEGRKLWATSRRMADIERVIENAEYYQVPATAIKTGFRRLLNSSKILGYSPAEVKAIRKAAQTGVVSDLMATFGSRLGAIASMATGGPAGAALGYGATTALRAGSTASQASRANAAMRAVAERSGMVRQEQRIPFRELMKLPPREAQRYLNRNSQK